MRIHNARTFVTDPLFFITQKKKSQVKSPRINARVNYNGRTNYIVVIVLSYSRHIFKPNHAKTGRRKAET